MTSLTSFLRDLSREPFCYGRSDCALTLADWCQVRRGADPADWLRGAYDDEASCAAVLRGHGGLARLVREIAAGQGLDRTHSAVAGDIAVVRFGRLHFGAIRTASGKWAIKASDGLIVTADCRVVAAWSV